MNGKIWSNMVLAMVLGVVCSGARSAQVTVFAASSLTNAFKAMASAYEAEHAGVRVILNAAASDVLVQQVVNGAPADVFASADAVAMDKAVSAAAVVPGTRRDFATNEVVMITPAEQTTLVSIDALQRAEVKRVTYGNPASVPVGRYTRSALERDGMWSVVQAKGVPAQNVRQALSYVARGEVDAGFVFATDAAVEVGKVRVAARLKPVTPVSYAIARVERSHSPEEADRFIAFVLSAEGQAILARHGFLAP